MGQDQDNRKDALTPQNEVCRLSTVNTVESSNKRSQLETAFRFCRDAFVEVSSVLISVLESRENLDKNLVVEIKKSVTEAIKDAKIHEDGRMRSGLSSGGQSYASALSRPGVHISRGQVVEAPISTSFLIIPEDTVAGEIPSSQATRDIISKVFNPAECALKIKKVSLSRDKAVRIEADSPDLERVRSHPGLVKAGLRVVESTKMDPRLIVYGINVSAKREEIQKEIIEQNLNGIKNKDLKVIYVYSPRSGKTETSCVIEVSSEVRDLFYKQGRIYHGYSAHKFADHIRIVQCYNCLAFGHYVRNCKRIITLFACQKHGSGQQSLIQWCRWMVILSSGMIGVVKMEERDLRNLDPGRIQEDLNGTDWSSLFAAPSIDEKVEIFNRVVLGCLDKYTPLCWRHFKRLPAPWITSDIKEAIKKRNKARRKTALITPIPKIKCPASVQDYRPISILSAMSKILEKIVSEQIQDYIERDNLHDLIQFAYRRGHSTQTCIIRFIDDVRQAIDKR
ncbi:hypothetical protein DMN91_010565 [Ooceraea biroi]|uniref:CCHC-type domain-containing protein n=1 Tax=Ooceraea biroi TaxID=2015173 RepID=A0A3L8D7P5_OOCBI|nr:hypothetical protein DMN91_010565 [Ooceraea biroi]